MEVDSVPSSKTFKMLKPKVLKQILEKGLCPGVTSIV